MEVNLSKGVDDGDKLRTILKQEPGRLQEHDLIFREQTVFHDLYNFTLIMKDALSWNKNIGILNKPSESVRLKKAWNEKEDFEPEFEFSDFEWNLENVSRVIHQADKACEMIDREMLNDYSVETLTVEDMRNLYRGTFEEFRLQAQVAANIKDEEQWRKSCLRVWPMNDKTFKKAVKTLEKDFGGAEEDKNLYAEDLKSMWHDELERLGISYNIEIREVPGCFNIPEEETVVVAKGSETERQYSKSEAEALTMHELFHVIRTYNGNRVMEDADLPPILGLHTPFYDRIEEGGAVYREYQTDVIMPNREKDYALRVLAAYYTEQQYSFNDVVQKLVEHGATLKRAFALAARNREILRHHIYMDGYYDWDRTDELWPLMLGKVNHEWAEKLRREVEADGVVKSPPIDTEKVFESPY